MLNRALTSKKNAFTLMEIMIAVTIMVILAAVVVVAVGGVEGKAKISQTQAQIRMLGQAVTAFKQSTGYFPLSVPEDVWTSSWDATNGFSETVRWDGQAGRPKWNNYFVSTANRPKFTWSVGNPTNIHMLGFQLEQVPESNNIYGKIKENNSVVQQVYFDSTGSRENWKKADDKCQLSHPLDATGSRIVYQMQDAWGNPLRFWTSDILNWARGTGNWDDTVQQLLSTKLQQANWGFFIESAGKDGKFGWWGDDEATLNGRQAEDNIYSTDQ